MKEIVKKVFSKKVTTPVFVIFGFFGILNFIIFPGLITPDTVSNIVSALLAVVTLALSILAERRVTLMKTAPLATSRLCSDSVWEGSARFGRHMTHS